MQKRIRALLCFECMVLVTLGVGTSFWASNLDEQLILWCVCAISHKCFVCVCYLMMPVLHRGWLLLLDVCLTHN